MRVVFRVDASNCMGTGHLMRCLTLAEALCERGVETRFVCRAHPGNLIELLQGQSLPVTVLPEPEKIPKANSEDYTVWLGVSQAEDAAQTIEALNGHTPDWLIVDHYGLDADWEQRLRPHTSSIMVIDDLANRPHDCDLLLDQNFTEENENPYQSLLPENCQILLGPRFSLLKPEYAVYRRTLQPRDGEVRRVLVFFGGSDRRNMTGLTLDALSAPEFTHLEVDVVIGANNQHQAELEQQITVRPKTNQYALRQHLADLMVQADLAIGAGGATTWERMCLGLPVLMISISENQRPVCEALSRSGLIQYLGDASSVRVMDLAVAIKDFIGNHDRVLALSTQNQLIVDGLGAQRLAELIDPTPVEKLRLRPAQTHDMGLYFNWANDPKVRQQAIKTEPISWKCHKEWFANKFSDPQSYLFVLEAGSLPVGQIRFDREGDDTHIDYSLDPLVRGRGWGAHLVRMGISLLQENKTIKLRADVKVGNQISQAIFMRLGFDQVQLDKARGVYVFCK